MQSQASIAITHTTMENFGQLIRRESTCQVFDKSKALAILFHELYSGRATREHEVCECQIVPLIEEVITMYIKMKKIEQGPSLAKPQPNCSAPNSVQTGNGCTSASLPGGNPTVTYSQPTSSC